jgi:hypothetical protein
MDYSKQEFTPEPLGVEFGVSRIVIKKEFGLIIFCILDRDSLL